MTSISFEYIPDVVIPFDLSLKKIYEYNATFPYLSFIISFDYHDGFS